MGIRKFTPVFNRTCPALPCPALTPLLQLMTPSRASGTADNCAILVCKSVHLSFQPKGSLKADPRPEAASWTNLRPERAEVNPEKADWRPDRAALKPAKSVGAY